jgi:hypothetical protein
MAILHSNFGLSGFNVPKQTDSGNYVDEKQKERFGCSSFPPNKEQTAKMENKKLRNQVNFVVCSGL